MGSGQAWVCPARADAPLSNPEMGAIKNHRRSGSEALRKISLVVMAIAASIAGGAGAAETTRFNFKGLSLGMPLEAALLVKNPDVEKIKAAAKACTEDCQGQQAAAKALESATSDQLLTCPAAPSDGVLLCAIGHGYTMVGPTFAGRAFKATGHAVEGAAVKFACVSGRCTVAWIQMPDVRPSSNPATLDLLTRAHGAPSSHTASATGSVTVWTQDDDSVTYRKPSDPAAYGNLTIQTLTFAAQQAKHTHSEPR